LADTSFINQIEGLATVNPDFLSSLQALATPVTNVAQLSTPPAFFTAIPSPYNSVLLSVYSQELALASSYGLLSSGGSAAITAPQATNTAAEASVSSALGSIITSAEASASAATGSSTPSASISHGAAARPTGVIAMGAVAGLIGGIAAIL
jgi:hypothetical protein